MLAQDNYWKIKILALLHDPPHKALNIQQHERRAHSLLSKLFTAEELQTLKNQFKSTVKQADILASVADRVQLPNGRQVDFYISREQLLFLHPLSGASKSLSFSRAADRHFQQNLSEELENLIQHEIDKLVLEEQSDRNWKRVYFHLYFVMKHCLVQKYPDVAYLPADTRSPAHSIFQHQDLAAALTGSMLNPMETESADTPVLMQLYSHGVQEFIQGARTCRDLFTNSFLLSGLMTALVKQAVLDLGPDGLLSPDPRQQQLLMSELMLELSNIEAAEFLDEGQILTPTMPNTINLLVPKTWAEQAQSRLQAAASKWFQEIAEPLTQKAAALHLSVHQNDFEDALESSLKWGLVSVSLPQGPVQEEEFLNLARSLKIDEQKIEQRQRLVDVLPPELRYGSSVSMGLCYAVAMDVLAALRHQQKMHRVFEQPANGRGLDKCSLRGDAEVLTPVGANSHQEVRKAWRAMPNSVKPGEKLSASGFVTRFSVLEWLKPKLESRMTNTRDLDLLLKFPSLEDISLANFKLKVAENSETESAKAVLEAAKRVLQLGSGEDLQIWFQHEKLSSLKGYDWFFKLCADCWNPQALKDRLGQKFLGASKELLKASRQYVAQSQGDVSAIPFVSLGRFVAVLHFDGDNLGKILGGEQGLKALKTVHPDIRELYQSVMKEDPGDLSWVSPAYHKAISEALGNFSMKCVRSIVEDQFGGKLIYAGGDDVLAILAPEVAVECARQLHVAFTQDFDDQHGMMMGHQASGSAGLTIFPAHFPFSLALDKVREAEARAKTEGRRRLCLNIVRPGGDEVIVCEPWDSELWDASKSPVCSLIGLHREKVLSPKLGYALARSLKHLVLEMQEETVLSIHDLQKLVSMELKRLAEQHTMHKEQLPVVQDVLDKTWRIALSCDSRNGLEQIEYLKKLLGLAVLIERGGSDAS